MRTRDEMVEQLFEDFCCYQQQTEFIFNLRENKGARHTRPKQTPDALEALGQMLDWCNEKGVEPRRWLFVLHAVRKWKFPIKLARGHLCSEKVLPKFATTRGLGFFRARVAATSEAAAMGDADPNRDVFPAIEGRKQGYAQTGQVDRCVDEMMTSTYGYHPKSPVCTACPERHRCAIGLASLMPFDILALRDGRLSAADAERIARSTP